MGMRPAAASRCQRRGSRAAARFAGTAAVLLVALSGCAQPQHERSGSPELSGMTPERLLGYAEQALTGRCMRAHGFAYHIAPPPAGFGDDDGETGPFRYGIDDIGWAREHGFGAPARTGQTPSRSDANSRYVNGLRESERRRYLTAYFGEPGEHSVETTVGDITTGVSTTGCLARARKTLYGDPRTWFRPDVVAGNIGGLIRQRVTEDQRYLRAVRQWSGCMANRGISASDPGHLRERFDRHSRGMAARTSANAERRWAIAEAECAIRTGMTTTARAVESRHEAAIRAKYRAELDRHRAIESEAVRRARRILPSP